MLYIVAKGIISAVHYLQDEALYITYKMKRFSFRSGCVVCEAFKRKLVYSVVVAIAALNNFVVLLKSLIANMLK